MIIVVKYVWYLWLMSRSEINQYPIVWLFLKGFSLKKVLQWSSEVLRALRCPEESLSDSLEFTSVVIEFLLSSVQYEWVWNHTSYEARTVKISFNPIKLIDELLSFECLLVVCELWIIEFAETSYISTALKEWLLELSMINYGFCEFELYNFSSSMIGKIKSLKHRLFLELLLFLVRRFINSLLSLMLQYELIVAGGSSIRIELLVNEIYLLQRLWWLLVSNDSVNFSACLENLSSEFILVIDPDPMINVVCYLRLEAVGHL